MSFFKQSPKQSLDITIKDDVIYISRNYGSPLIVKTRKNKNLLALFDALMNPQKYTLNIHDLREKEVFSRISFSIEN